MSVSPRAIRAEPIKIQWDASMPVFAKEEFLKAVGDEYGWLGGFDQFGTQKCILPYTIVHKAGFRLVRFRTSTTPCCEDFDLREEKVFLNCVVGHFRRTGADVIIPASNNSIFRTYPDGAEAAPYGTYVVDLRQPEEILWRNCNRTSREVIRKAKKDGVFICEGMEYWEPAWALIQETFQRSRMPFMSAAAFQRYLRGLGENGRLMVAEYQGALQSCRLFGFSIHSAYAIYSGNALRHHKGSSKLLYWEAMRSFQSRGVQAFDFYGARVHPQPGSKQEGINLVKEQFGAHLHQGFLWKFPLRRWRARAYSIGVKLLRGGDIVDQERHKLNTEIEPAEELANAPARR